MPTYLGSGNQRSLLLPAASGFGTYIFNAEWEDFIQLVKSQPEQKPANTPLRSKSPAVLVSIVYHPGTFGVFQGNTAPIQVRPWSMTILSSML